MRSKRFVVNYYNYRNLAGVRPSRRNAPHTLCPDVVKMPPSHPGIFSLFIVGLKLSFKYPLLPCDYACHA